MGGKRTKDGLRLVSNASKLGIGSFGDDYESLRQADELVEVTHVGCLGSESVKGTEVSSWEVENSPCIVSPRPAKRRSTWLSTLWMVTSAWPYSIEPSG